MTHQCLLLFLTLAPFQYKLTEEVQELRKQIREIISDRSLREEIGHWRDHTEKVLRQRDDFHRAEVDALMDLLRTKLTVKEDAPAATAAAASGSAAATYALAQQQQLLAQQAQYQQYQELLKQVSSSVNRTQKFRYYCNWKPFIPIFRPSVPTSSEDG